MCYQNSCYWATVHNSHQVSFHGSWRKLTLGAYFAPIFVYTGDHFSIDMCAIPNSTHYSQWGHFIMYTFLCICSTDLYLVGDIALLSYQNKDTQAQLLLLWNKRHYMLAWRSVDKIRTSGWLKPGLTVIKGPIGHASTFIARQCYHADIL